MRPLPRGDAQRRCLVEGRALVSGRLLADFCRSLPNKPVEMSIEGAKVTLTCGSARFSLQTMPSRIPVAADDARSARKVRSELFAQRGRPGGHAAGRDDMLPVLTGVRLELDGSSISMLATDRFRLSPARAAVGARDPDLSRPRWCRRRCSQTPRIPGPAARRSPSRCPLGTGEGIIGFEGSGRRRDPAYDDPASRGEFPKVRSLFPARPDPGACGPFGPDRRRQSVWPWWPSANTR